MNMQKKTNAFTLIELLVVIAIIAILAAILFPVFAQARESAYKAQNLSAVKQTGTAVNMYMADNDDVMPLTNPFNGRFANGMFGWGLFPNPNPTSANENAHENGWLAKLMPYVKNKEIFANQNPKHEFPVWNATAGHPAVGLRTNLTINGYLNAFSGTEIASPSSVPLTWQGLGIVNYTNGTFAVNPLAVPITGTPAASFTDPIVKFQRSGASCTKGWMGNWGQWHRSFFVHGEGFVASRVDSSAKYYRAVGGAQNSPFRKLTSDPGRWPGTLERSAEVGESTESFFNLDPVDGPAGCTYSAFFSPMRQN